MANAHGAPNEGCGLAPLVLSKVKGRQLQNCMHGHMASGDSIPIVDLEGLSREQDLSGCPQVQQIHSAFTTVGFVFIKNHGIQRKTVRLTSQLPVAVH